MLGFSKLPRAPFPLPLPQDRHRGKVWESESVILHLREWLPSNELERNLVTQDLVNPEKIFRKKAGQKYRDEPLHRKKLRTEAEGKSTKFPTSTCLSAEGIYRTH